VLPLVHGLLKRETTMEVTTHDGESLSYRVLGTGEATPMMTVHGLVSSTHHWLDFNPYFSTKRSVISWDYRGHGGCSAPRDCSSISVAQFADDAHAVWRATNLGPTITVGLSFGVQVALELWRRHPEAIKALVLICGTAGHPLDRVSSSTKLRRSFTAMTRAVMSPTLGLMRTRLGARLAREMAYLSGGARRDACPPDMLESLFQHVSALDPRLVTAVTKAYLDHDAHDVLPTITVPTLIIAGDKDQLTPVETAQRMKRAIPNSQLVVFRGHSHLVQVEKPREVHATIEQFLRDYEL
jgi:3-oxoadipate enol-lactonase